MTTLHTRKNPLLRGVAPTPSKIPILSQRCSEFSSVKSCSLDQENQDPRKPPLSTQSPLIDSSGLKSKTLHQKEKSQRLGSTQLRNPLEELKPSSGRPNVGLVSQPQTEALRAIEFVADPTALATILSECSVFSIPGSQDPYPSAGTCQGFLLLKTGGIRTPRKTTEFRGSASLPPKGEHEAAPRSGEGGRALLGLAQRVPLRETGEKNHTRTLYSSLKRFTTQRKTRFTPAQSLPRVQQEQIAVRLFDQESRIMLQKGSGKPPAASTSGPHPFETPNLQELKMQRISLLQQLLQQEIEGLGVDKCAPLNGGSALEMTKLEPLLADISRTLNAPAHNPGTSLLGLSRHTGVAEPDLAEECGEPQPHGAEKHGEPQPCPGAETKVVQPSSTTDPEPPVPCWIAEPEPPEPCLPVLPGPLLPHLQGQAEPLEACPWMELGPSAADSLEARKPASSPQPCWSQGPPATTSLTFSSQSSLCASPPIHSLQSLRSPTGQSGPSSLAPRTLALRQRLKACLSAIHCFYEARLDDECAFYTSRTLPPGPTRLCTNPVATLLDWQDALQFIPVGSVVPQDSPS
ncbi:Tastin [Microtus ochrogaster]|uniref:Tastin n=1 Tax=Microtus ochrogaster TaxID=79684 RepID=A0A8J6GH80_MICOH|nr:Tastin [Microtus ochrogaster]